MPPKSSGAFLQVVNAKRSPQAAAEKKVRGFRLSTWVRYFSGMTVAGELHDTIPADELAVPIRPKRDEDGVVQIGKQGKPKYAIGTHFNANVKSAMENIEDYLATAGDQLVAANPDKAKALRATMKAAAERIVPRDLFDIDLAIEAYNAAKAAMATPTPDALAQAETVADGVPTSTETEKEPVAA